MKFKVVLGITVFSMKVRILGCGTSTGVPVIGCGCAICASTEPRNARSRSSVLVSSKGRNVLIDTSTDLRAQSLLGSIKRIDAVLFTHAHADHVHGIDELRVFNKLGDGPIPCYGSTSTVERIRGVFTYIFDEGRGDGWRPELLTTAVSGTFEPFGSGSLVVEPIEVEHASTTIYGYRIGGFAYLTDCSSIPKASMERLQGLKLLIIGALRQRPHPSHFSIGEAIEAARELGVEKTVLTHLGHNVDYVEDGASLPKGVELAYDGMEMEL